MGEIERQLKVTRKVIENDVKQYRLNIIQYMARDIANELKESAHLAIKEFYESYHPGSIKGSDLTKPYAYRRHYNFWKTYHTSIKAVSGREGVLQAGVSFTYVPDVYSNVPKPTPLDDYDHPLYVFTRVYLEGIHGIGGVLNGAEPLDPTPWEKIENKRDEIIKNYSDYQQKAEEKAKRKGGYSVLFKNITSKKIGRPSGSKDKTKRYKKKKK